MTFSKITLKLNGHANMIKKRFTTVSNIYAWNSFNEFNYCYAKETGIEAEGIKRTNNPANDILNYRVKMFLRPLINLIKPIITAIVMYWMKK